MTEAAEPTSFGETFAADLAAAEAAEAGEQVETTEGVSTEESTETSTEGEATTTPTYKVTVEGEELEVTLDEALNGYQRQSDYTRKTQALASDRERLADLERIGAALEQDPQAALRELARIYEVDLAPGEEVDLEDLDPLERDVLDIKDFVSEQRNQQILREVDEAVEQVKQAYGDTELDGDELLQFAIDHKIGDLDAAYRALRYEQLANDRNAAVETRRAEEDAAAEAAKRAAQVVEGGSNRSAGTVSNGSEYPTSVREAWDAAVAELQG